MYAPLALMFVHSYRPFVGCLNHSFLRAPVAPIAANPSTTTKSLLKATSHTGAISGGIASGFAALILIVVIITLVWRRRRQNDLRRSAGSYFSGPAMEAYPRMIVTPFDPTLARETGFPFWTTSDSPFSQPPLPPWQSAAPVPVALTGKELARLRSATVVPPHSYARSSSSGSRPASSPAIGTTEGGTEIPPPDPRRLQTEMEFLRHEMQQLRAERFEPPPSYGDGVGI